MSWPKLSEDLAGPRSPDRCQACGAVEWAELARWREHDDRDGPTPVLVVLCRKCAKRLVGPHPRLYEELHRNDPAPGCMALCVACAHRRGTACGHPDAKANGGPGVLLDIKRPHRMHVSRSPRRLSGTLILWPEPASACNRREEVPPPLDPAAIRAATEADAGTWEPDLAPILAFPPRGIATE